MNNYVSTEELIDLVEQQKPTRHDVINALKNCSDGHWRNKAFYQFVDSTNANKPGSLWQFDECISLEHPTKGTIVIDLLKNQKIGAIEFYNLLD